MSGLDYSLGAVFGTCLVWLKTGRSPIAWTIRGLLHVQAFWACLQDALSIAWETGRRRYREHFERARWRAGG